MLRHTKIVEVDTDPSNNPGRPDDAFEYIGMRPEPTWAMAHPSLAGAGADAGGGEAGSSAEPVDGEEPTVEPTEEA